MKTIMKNKKAQEEMVGFVALVIIVAVVALVFLALLIRNEKTSFDSILVQQFSESLLYTTNECVLGNSIQLASFAELFDACYNSPLMQCSTGENSCEYLNKTIPLLLRKTWNINNQSAFIGASIKAVFKDRISSEEKEFFSYSEGNCKSSSVGGESILPDSRKLGNIVVRARICVNE